MKLCGKCGNSAPDEALFCSACGAQLSEYDGDAEEVRRDEEAQARPAESAPVAEAWVEPKVNKRTVRLPVVSLVRNFVIMAVAIVMMIGAFMPFSAVRSKDLSGGMLGILRDSEMLDEMDDMNFTITTVDAIALLFDSTVDLELQDLEDSAVYEQLEELSEELEYLDEDDLEHLSAKEKRTFKELYRLTLRLMMQLDYISPTAGIFASAILGVLYMALCAALIVFSLLNLLASFGLFGNSRAKIYKTTLALLTAVPVSILATFFAFSSFDGGRLGGMAWTCLVISALCILLVAVLRYVFSKKETGKVIALRAVTAAMALAIFCLAMAPVFTVSYKTESRSGRRVTAKYSYGAEFFDDFVLTEEKYESYEDMLDMSKSEKKGYMENLLNGFSRMEKKEITGDAGKLYNGSIIVDLMGITMLPPFLGLMSVGLLPFLLLALSALALLWQNLYFFASGNYVRPVANTAKICTAVFAVVSLAMGIVLVSVISANARVYMTSAYTVGISAGVIILTVVSMVPLFLSSGITPKVKKAPKAKKTINIVSEQF